MKYLIGILVTMAVIILIIIKLLTSGGGSPTVKPTSLTNYATTDTVMRLRIENPVQASVNHREIQVDIGQDEATLTVYRGYQNEIVRSKSYDMNTTAYADFLFGLKNSGGYTLGDANPADRDERGYCATGLRYMYEIIDGNGKAIQHFWSTSCGAKTFKGNISTVLELFRLQIPDYSDLTRDVDL